MAQCKGLEPRTHRDLSLSILITIARERHRFIHSNEFLKKKNLLKFQLESVANGNSISNGQNSSLQVSNQANLNNTNGVNNREIFSRKQNIF